MNRLILALLAAATLVIGCDRSPSPANNAKPQEAAVNQKNATPATSKAAPATLPAGLVHVVKSNDQWKKELTPEQYQILREKGTERARTSPLDKTYDAGVYVCAGCGLELFSSEHKFDSKTGWPSYWQPIKKGYVKEEADNAHGWNRTEVLCARCDGHLGHVFDDGPQPTGLRYCINGVALKFVKKEDK